MKILFLKSFGIFLILFALSNAVLAQSDTGEESNATLESQFQNLKSGSNSYQIYKVVNENELDGFWSSVEDSINVYNGEIRSLRKDQKALQQEVKELETQVSERDSSLANQQSLIETMTFLGIRMAKQTYKVVSWSIILVLLIVLLVFYYRFKSSNKVTVRTKKDYEELQREFEAHRQRTRENETKLKRELQTEINQVVELKELLGTRKN